MLTRRSQLKPGGPLQRRTPLRSTTRLRQTAGLVPSPFKRKAPKKRPKAERIYAEACHGQECYLLLPFFAEHPRETVVPAHSNSQQDGKGMGIKAADEKTVPACFFCHAELDQGKRMSKEERRQYWLSAYERWKPARAALLGLPADGAVTA